MDAKTIWETLAVAFGMFSAVPMPEVAWDKNNMRYALCFLPAVGLAVGLGAALWMTLAHFLALPGLVPAAGLCLVPVVVTGGFHLDGFVDTCDALASHAPPARKQEILHDSHAGAFAIIHTGAYFVAYFALCTALKLEVRTALLLGLAYVLERAYAGGCAASLPLANNSGLAHLFAQQADKITVHKVCTVLVYVCAALLILVGIIRGSLMVLAQMAVMELYKRMAAKEFGGLSGDLQGWFIQTSELAMLAALVLGGALEGLL